MIFSQDFSLSITFNVARAALDPILSVQKVLLIKDFSAAFMTSLFPKTAVTAYPFPRALPNIATSGSTSYSLCSPPKFFLKPEVHSSNTNTMLLSSANFLICCKKLFSGSLLRKTSILITPIFLVLTSSSSFAKLLYSNG